MLPLWVGVRHTRNQSDLARWVAQRPWSVASGSVASHEAGRSCAFEHSGAHVRRRRPVQVANSARRTSDAWAPRVGGALAAKSLREPHSKLGAPRVGLAPAHGRLLRRAWHMAGVGTFVTEVLAAADAIGRRPHSCYNSSRMMDPRGRQCRLEYKRSLEFISGVTVLSSGLNFRRG